MDIRYYKLQQTREYGYNPTVCVIFSLGFVVYLNIYWQRTWGMRKLLNGSDEVG